MNILFDFEDVDTKDGIKKSTGGLCWTYAYSIT